MRTPSSKIMSVLINAAADGRDDDVQTWIDTYGREFLNQRDFYGWTALMSAAREGRKSTVERLLNAGADPFLKDDHGKTAADYAKKMHYFEVVKILEDTASVIKLKNEAAKIQEERDAIEKQIISIQEKAPTFKIKKRGAF